MNNFSLNLLINLANFLPTIYFNRESEWKKKSLLTPLINVNLEKKSVYIIIKYGFGWCVMPTTFDILYLC